MKSRNGKKIIRICVSIAVLGFLLYSIDLEKVVESIRHVHIPLLGIALSVVIINRFIMSFKWNLLLRAKSIVVPQYDVFRIYYMSTFLGLFLPPTVGGDVIRSYYLSKKKYPLTDVVSSILVERFLGFILLFVFGAFGVIFFISMFKGASFNFQKLLLVLFFLSLMGILGFFLSLNGKFSNAVLKLLGRFHDGGKIGKVSRKIEELYRSYLLFGNHKKTLAFFILLTMLEILTVILWNYIVATAFHVKIPFTYFFVFIPILLVLVRLPISIDGFGINEGGYVYFLSLVGIESSLGFNIGLVNHIITLIGLLPGGLFYVLGRELKEDIKEIEQQEQYQHGE